jgi:hypothetical protein
LFPKKHDEPKKLEKAAHLLSNVKELLTAALSSSLKIGWASCSHFYETRVSSGF